MRPSALLVLFALLLPIVCMTACGDDDYGVDLGQDNGVQLDLRAAD